MTKRVLTPISMTNSFIMSPSQKFWASFLGSKCLFWKNCFCPDDVWQLAKPCWYSCKTHEKCIRRKPVSSVVYHKEFIYIPTTGFNRWYLGKTLSSLRPMCQSLIILKIQLNFVSVLLLVQNNIGIITTVKTSKWYVSILIYWVQKNPIQMQTFYPNVPHHRPVQFFINPLLEKEVQRPKISPCYSILMQFIYHNGSNSLTPEITDCPTSFNGIYS